VGKHAKKRRWWRRHYVLTILILVLILGVGAVSGLVISVASTPLAPATMTSQLGSSIKAPEHSTTMTWPGQGEASYVVPFFAQAQDSANQTSVPIASITKLMTAYVVLNDYPLAPGESGPTITVTQAEVDAYKIEKEMGQSVVAIEPGEVLTEYQLLQGLLVHSGNDYAELLAKLDARSISAFVGKMNVQAAKLGMTKTHYADPSGFDPASVSTPHDQLILTPLLMSNPVVAATVAKTSVELPVAGKVTTYTPLLGTNGVVGVKSGVNSEAGGCDVMAVNYDVGGHVVQIFSAVTGQRDGNRLNAAGQAALSVAKSVEAMIQSVGIAGTSIPVATIGWPHSSVSLVLKNAITIPAWPGQTITISVTATKKVTGAEPENTVLASVHVTSPSLKIEAPALTETPLQPPNLFERVV
jgi:D-alanyl-D-alanine carboxypeptidase (penicillin-binding protein 5/6)